MHLKQIKLKRFFGFKDFQLDLTEFTVLVGPNNGGKTTVLRTFARTYEEAEAAKADALGP